MIKIIVSFSTVYIIYIQIDTLFQIFLTYANIKWTVKYDVNWTFFKKKTMRKLASNNRHEFFYSQEEVTRENNYIKTAQTQTNFASRFFL